VRGTLSRIKEVYSAQQIQTRIAEMGKQITSDYKDLDRLVVIGVLKGAIFFLADLVRTIELKDPLQIEYVRLSSYGGGKESTGVVHTPYLELPDIRHRHILVVEDIIDSGRTAKFFKEYLQDQFDPASLKLAAFLDKPSRRVAPIQADYVGYSIEDFFVVGYGLDYAEKYRELPYLGEILNDEQN
jgi:hypoxanthine phosphoribosyltransferase